MPELIKHYPSFIEEKTAENFLEVLRDNVKWYNFALSPKSRKVSHWDPCESNKLVNNIIFSVIEKILIEKNVKEIQSVFLNMYIDGKDYCSYHRDLYGTNVYTLSLGSSRDLLVKKDGEKAIKYTLNNGDLYYMALELQKEHKHSIPKRLKVDSTRISIVFFTI